MITTLHCRAAGSLAAFAVIVLISPLSPACAQQLVCSGPTPPVVTVVDVIPQAQSSWRGCSVHPSLAVNPDDPSSMVVSIVASPSFLEIDDHMLFLFQSITRGNTWTLNLSLLPNSCRYSQFCDIAVGWQEGEASPYTVVTEAAYNYGYSPWLFAGELGSGALVPCNPSGPYPIAEGCWFGEPAFQIGDSSKGLLLGMWESTDSKAIGRAPVLLRVKGAPSLANDRKVLVPSTESSAGYGDGVAPRIATHPDGTIYVAYLQPTTSDTTKANIVVKWSQGWNSDWQSPSLPSATVQGIDYLRDIDGGKWSGGPQLSIAVDPTNSQKAYLAWRDGRESPTLHLRSLTNGTLGSEDLRTIPGGTLPALAVNDRGRVGFLYQQFLTVGGSEKVKTILEVSFHNGNSDFDETYTLAEVPTATECHYYERSRAYGNLLAVKEDFYGVFQAYNDPNPANFPSCVTFQNTLSQNPDGSLKQDYLALNPFFFHAPGVLPQDDFYVRDSMVDNGDQSLPADQSDFLNSDVWNRWTAQEPGILDPGGAPQHQEPQESPAGALNNFAFARVRRRAPAPEGSSEIKVKVAFFYANEGEPFGQVGETRELTFAWNVNELSLDNGEPWRLPAAHSKKGCIAVEIWTDNDPLSTGLEKHSCTLKDAKEYQSLAKSVEWDNNKTLRIVTLPDFYVRDSAIDVGDESGDDHDAKGFVTSDVWNRTEDDPGNLAPGGTPENQLPWGAPDSKNNYAFVRVRRITTADSPADVPVYIHFFYANNPADPQSSYAELLPITTVTFKKGDTEVTLGNGLPWALPQDHSKLICLAVQISTDPDATFDLQGIHGCEENNIITKDNHKALRISNVDDFYVRDWTAPNYLNGYDDGLEPSKNPVFYATSDVWNQSTPPCKVPLPNEAPQNVTPVDDDNGNYACVRISRRAAGPQADVTASFFWAPSGVGSNFIQIGSPAQLEFPGDVTELVPDGVHWTLEEDHGAHACMAVEISAPGDGLSSSLLKKSPGGLTDSEVVNDNNKAQRNIEFSTAERGSEQHRYFLAHNWDISKYSMQLRFDVPSETSSRLGPVRMSVEGARTKVLKPGETFVIADMEPGEDRMLEVEVQVREGAGADVPLPLYFTEMRGDKAINGFAIALKPVRPAAAARHNLLAQRTVLSRLSGLYKNEAAVSLAAQTREFLGRRGEEVSLKDYRAFLRETAPLLARSMAALTPTNLSTRGSRPGKDLCRLRWKLWFGRTSGVVAAHSDLLESLDAAVTVRQLASGNPADIPQTLRWGRALAARLPALSNLPATAAYLRDSDAFLAAAGRIGYVEAEYAGFIARSQDFFAGIARVFPRASALAADRVALERAGESLPALQKAHRQFLLDLSRLEK